MNGIQMEDHAHELRGAVHLDIYKAGKLVESDTDHNLIVTVGRTQLAKLLGGGYTGHITQVGVGTGSAAAADGDTGLTGAVLIDIGGVEYDTAKVRFNFEIGTNQANGVSIREFGLFFADGTLFSHRVRKSVIGKENDIKISGYWDIYM
jgi:hypothetical protein